MATGDSTDMFMILVDDKGPLMGESTAELRVPGRPSNSLTNGFEPGRMFEISKFDFGVGVGQEALDEMEYPDRKGGSGSARQSGMPPRRKIRPGQSRDETPVTIQPISFTREMDRASHLLLHHTIKRTFFRRAAIVKRKSAGGGAAGEAYLRIECKGVMLIEASWSDDQPVEETYSFHARAITVYYRPQKADGSLGALLHGFWSMVPNEQETPL